MRADDIASLDSWPEISAFLVLARYYSLVRFSTLISTRVDTEGYAVEGDRDTIFDNVMELRKAAVKEAASYGYILETDDEAHIGSGNQPVDQDAQTPTWKRGVLPTDYMEAWPYYDISSMSV